MKLLKSIKKLLFREDFNVPAHIAIAVLISTIIAGLFYVWEIHIQGIIIM